jgi:hypothetical protein
VEKNLKDVVRFGRQAECVVQQGVQGVPQGEIFDKAPGIGVVGIEDPPDLLEVRDLDAGILRNVEPVVPGQEPVAQDVRVGDEDEQADRG